MSEYLIQHTRKAFPGLRKDGCVWALTLAACILSAIVLSVLAVPLAPLVGMGMLIRLFWVKVWVPRTWRPVVADYLCVESETCCGFLLRPPGKPVEGKMEGDGGEDGENVAPRPAAAPSPSDLERGDGPGPGPGAEVGPGESAPIPPTADTDTITAPGETTVNVLPATTPDTTQAGEVSRG